MLGSTPALFEVDPPSPPSMEALMADSLMFEEPFLQDPDKEVIFDLASKFGALMIKNVLDLLRASTSFQMAAGTPLLLFPFITP